MLIQRRIGTVFDMFVRAVGAWRYSAVAVPLAVLFVVVALSVRGSGRVGAEVDGRADVVVAKQVAMLAGFFGPTAVVPWADAAAQDVAKPPAPPVPSRAPLKLSPEQQKVAHFVAKKYRIAVGDVQHLVAHAYRAARELRLDPYLVLAIISIESNFNPNAHSRAGAQGVMQVLTRVHVDKFAPFGGVASAFDPMANISVGSRILKEYLVREGSVEGALKSYVGAAMLEHDSGYGYKVLSERERIAAAAAGRPVPAQPLKPPAPADDGDGTRDPFMRTMDAHDARVGDPVRDAAPAAPAGDPVLDAAADSLRADATRAALARIPPGLSAL